MDMHFRRSDCNNTPGRGFGLCSTLQGMIRRLDRQSFPDPAVGSSPTGWIVSRSSDRLVNLYKPGQ